MSIIKTGEVGNVYLKNKETDEILEKVYDAKDYVNGYGAVQFKEAGRWFYIDEELNLCGSGYDTVFAFKDGLARVIINGKYYFVDEEFNLLGQGYDYASPFKNDVSNVQNDNQWFSINKQFQVLDHSLVTFQQSER